jgi:hypothetical protein
VQLGKKRQKLPLLRTKVLLVYREYTFPTLVPSLLSRHLPGLQRERA